MTETSKDAVPAYQKPALANSKSVKTSILALIGSKGHVTFAEICRLPGCEGEFNLVMAPNMILWTGLSMDAAGAILELVKEEAVFMHPTDAFIYVIDGAHLNLPIARRPPSDMVKGFATPHWLPVTFDVQPPVIARKSKKH